MIGVEWSTKDDWIGDNFGYSFPGIESNVGDNPETLIIGRKRPIGPLLILLTIIIHNYIILRLGNLNH
jgi:hypothetical protein